MYRPTRPMPPTLISKLVSKDLLQKFGPMVISVLKFKRKDTHTSSELRLQINYKASME